MNAILKWWWDRMMMLIWILYEDKGSLHQEEIDRSGRTRWRDQGPGLCLEIEIMAMIMNVIMPWNFNHNDDEPEQWWNWQWHCLNISICQWRIEHISENILLKSVPQRVICSCTAWSVGFTCIKNSTLISKQIFSWGVRRKYWGFSWC